MISKTRNYNQGRVKELIENALREASENLQIPETGQKHKFPEFDKLPEKYISDESKSISVKCYNTETGEPLALCTIREKYLSLIHDEKLTDREHEYNLFRKYVNLISLETNGLFSLHPKELIHAENCTCICCLGSETIDDSEKYTSEDVFRDGFEGNIDAWNHANQ